eukprot:TRINITY_DN25140_c0_g1_i1.p1 TRINITY_DN25140_c0_g1~~TRINITY_DN25140_c0_g1_i1.p1  ORF type:complete len:510 (-),score=242.31 TRINITY_DN25140_c0_g1_i1:56-1585(-)
MAFHDNRLWLLSHIHNSFISSDDTGICEMVLAPETFKEEVTRVAKDQNLQSFLPEVLAGQEEVDTFRPHSPDMKGSSRPRANTALQLQQKMLPKEQEHITTIHWKTPPKKSEDIIEQEEELFPRKQVKDEPTIKMAVSLLTQQLESLTPGEEQNPWQQYARFEGSHYREGVVKRVEVFPAMEERSDNVPHSIKVACVKDAKVKDVVGLVCLKYTIEERLPRLEPPAENYSLFMCEEDGTLDSDFPALDWSEPFSKYGFLQLALVRRDSSMSGAAPAERVTLHLPDGTFSQVEVERADMTVGDLLEMGLHKRARNFPTSKVPLSYQLEAADVVGVALDPDSGLSTQAGSEFYIVRSNSKRVSGPREQAQGEPASFLEAPLFKSFNVQIITKVRTKVDIHLGISGERVEIDPQQQATWTVYKQKAATYDMDSIVSCEVVDKQGEDRKMFKMVYLTESGWRWTEFEGETDTVDAVVDKVNHLLEMRQSEARKLRKEYLENKEKKKGRRLSTK